MIRILFQHPDNGLHACCLIQVETPDMDTGRNRPYDVVIKWARTINVRALHDFIACVPGRPSCSPHVP